MIHVQPAEPGEAYELTLREEDQREVPAGWRKQVAQAIAENPSSFAARDPQGTLVALYGSVTLPNGDVSPWLLCHPSIKNHKRCVARHSREGVRALYWARMGGARVFNVIPKDSPGNRAYLRVLGFRIVPSEGDGPDLFYLP